MPSPATDNGVGLLMPNLLVILMVSWGIIASSDPLSSSRPSPLHEGDEEGLVEARLWEDPLSAVNHHIAKNENAHNFFRKSRSDFQADICSGKATPFNGRKISDLSKTWLDEHPQILKEQHPLCLIAMVPDGFQSTSTEKRRRIRYAILSGISESTSYLPPLNNRIGLSYYYSPSNSQAPPWEIPYEQIKPQHTIKDHKTPHVSEVFIIYLNERYLSAAILGNDKKNNDNSFNRLNDFISHLVPKKTLKGITPRIEIIGPSNSGLLMKLTKEMGDSYVQEKVKAAKKNTAPTTKKKNTNKKDTAEQEVATAPRSYTIHAVYPTLSRIQLNYWVNKSSNKTLNKAKKEAKKEVKTETETEVKTEQNIKQIIAASIEKYRKNQLQLESKVFTKKLKNNKAATHIFGKHRYDLKVHRSNGQTIEVIREAGDDLSLCHALVAELKNRGINIQNGNSSILILTEYDTLYGKSLPQSFRRAVWGEHIGKEGEDSFTLKHERQVRTVTYLRGLDGHTLHHAPSKPTGKDKDKVGDNVTTELAWSTSQFDYIRRLVKRIKDQERDHGKRFSAIGVMGSDVYDKLILLKALRKSFPHAEFFTTDLDATLLAPKEREVTRNLIVASPYGFSLREQLQGSIPPFRDSYQTATYLATLKAMYYFKPMRKGEHSSLTPIEPDRNIVRLYEIGNKNTRLLSLYKLDKVDKIGQSTNPESPIIGVIGDTLERWQESSADRVSYSSLNLLFFISIFLFIFLIYLFILSKSFNSIPECFRMSEIGLLGYRWQTLVHATFGIWLLLIFFTSRRIWELSSDASEEPFAAWNGISVWPSAIILMISTTLCLYCCWKSWFDLRYNRSKIEYQFHKILCPQGKEQLHQKQSDKKQKLKGLLLRIKQILSQTFIDTYKSLRFLFGFRKKNPLDLDIVWQNYTQASSQSCRIVRSLCCTFFFITIYYSIGRDLDFPINPARGEESRKLFLCIQVFSYTAALYLLFYIMDAHFLCYRFLHHVRRWLRPHSPPYEILENNQQASNEDLEDSHPHESQPTKVPGRWESQLAQISARRVGKVNPTIYYPFIVLFLVITSRNPIFDHFDWPLSLTISLIFSVLMLSGMAVMMQRKARTILQVARQRVTLAIYDTKITKEPNQVKEAKNREEAKEKREEHEALLTKELNILDSLSETIPLGIFSNPLFKAILLPLGGTGLFRILEVLGPSLQG